MGRTAYGVRGINLREGDEVVAMAVVREGGTMLTVAQNGYGKRTELEEYRLQSRGGVGFINIQTSDRNGKVVGMAYVHDDDEVMLISQQGMILRMKAGDVRVIGRATQGVRLLGMDEGDQVVAIAKLLERDDEPANGSNAAATDAVGTSLTEGSTSEPATLETPEAPSDETPDE
jgi:DNA gyrase subunit A